MLSEIKTYIFQPNCFTEANYNCTLIQERLINSVIYRLQDAIKKRMQGENYIQLSLFGQNTQFYISIEIPLSEIAKPAQYKFVKESIKKLASIVVELKYRNEAKKENRIRLVGLFRADIPEKGKRNSTILIEMDKMVAKKLIEIDLNEQGKPINYTKFIYEIALKSRIKYTSRIYKLLCSWRKSGQFIMTLDDFRKLLGIEYKYKFYRDIKRNVLLPAQKDLENIDVADCWFDCEANDFEVKEGNKVTKLFFRVITKEYKKEEEKRKEYVIHLLRTHYYFSDQDFRNVNGIFCYPNMSEVISKISYLNDYVREANVQHKKNYISESLLNEFGA
jgi:plasmid replication initiation protein